MDYVELRERILISRPDIDIMAVDQAYHFANEAHEGQTRYSGEPYIVHPVGATALLLGLHPDLESIQACLMHDVTEDTEATYEDIEQKFSSEVADLVQGMEKLAVVKLKEKSQQTDQWKNMFLAMANDVRIVFIKLADRLHNMKTLQHVPKHKQERIARETLIVHAAIASRLGMYQFKSELEDLCFKYLEPEAYQKLTLQLAESREKSQQYMEFATSQLEQLLVREGVAVDRVQGRMKHLWSIYQKMKRKDTESLEDIQDLFAIRVVLPDMVRNETEQVSHLYTALGILHGETVPLQDRFKDYVAVPKPNGYRSLHTTVMGLGGDLYEDPTEVQIRSLRMHQESELGIASHSNYKLDKKLVRPVNLERHKALHSAMDKVSAIVKGNPEIEGLLKSWVERYQHMFPEDRKKVEKILLKHGLSSAELDDIRKGRSQEHLKLKPNLEAQLAWLRGLAEKGDDSMELDLFPDKIFVLTPNKDVMELPRGATPVDFAYGVHTAVGNKMVHAKVNGRIVPLDYKLKNGQLVEVGTRSNAKPNRYWISIAKTSSARAKIKNWFNKQDRDGNIVIGRDLLNKEMEKIGEKALDERLTILKDYGKTKRGFSDREQILESIGLGSTTVGQVMKTLFGSAISEVPRKKSVQQGDRTDPTKLVLVTGEENLPVALSACCKPRPGNPIIGYVTRGSNIRIHKQSCSELSGLKGERFVSALWKT
ncbi:MAG: guanosine-3',5'-bis(diphosphate) 3'-pyrophosphohydrolase [Oceanicoccus sp.]|jgi:guanosine-3',5'-bis(diphosphate) 3'-pyrophosphohydrolase